MSFLIEGQDLPKEGEHYLLQINSDGTVYDAVGRRIAAQAVPIPPHGRLGDLDALKDKWTHKDLDLFSQGWGWLHDLNQAPTIIPAEPPKEEI